MKAVKSRMNPLYERQNGLERHIHSFSEETTIKLMTMRCIFRIYSWIQIKKNKQVNNAGPW